MFKIGDFSKLAQVSVKTLRYYAQLGLLAPTWIDRFTSYRYYSLEQLPRLNRILALKDLGFSLEQIRALLVEDLPPAELRGMLRLKQAELEQQLQQEQARLERIQARLRQIEQEGAVPAYEILLKRLPAQRIAGVRSVLPEISRLGDLFGELYACMQTQGLAGEPSLPSLAIYYDADFHDQEIDVEAAQPLAPRPPAVARLSARPLNASRLQVHELPAVASMASALHQGGYPSLGDAYRALLTWVEANDYRVTAPAREHYLRGVQSGAPPDQWITEVQLPVQKKPKPFFTAQTKEVSQMEPKFVVKPAMQVVGMLYEGKNEKNEIAQMWMQFNPRIREIQHIVDGAFGLCEPAAPSGEFRYLAGMAVSDASHVPDGMTRWDVPEQRYAVFPCTLPTLRETYRYAFETWLPKSGYKYNRGIDFEYYPDEDFNPDDPQHAGFEIYIPLE
jgi:predicted transcriptional regulator YdeE/DNA-binding transcriptional MerR regulator